MDKPSSSPHRLAGDPMACDPGRHEEPRENGMPVRIYTLGRFALVVDGRPLTFAGKTPHKPLELLQALIAFGGRTVSNELLCRAVWPDDDSDDPRNLFDNTLHRLRKLLGHRDALALSDSKLTLNPRVCGVDAWDFERLSALHLDKASGAPAADAMHLYQGHFLQLEAPHPWLLGYRERLHGRFLRLLLSEAGRLEALHRWDAAADWYARGIEVDPLDETLHQRVMHCLRRRGEESFASHAPLV